MNEKVFDFMRKNVNSLMNVKKVVERPGQDTIIYSPFFASINMKDLVRYNLEIANGGVYNSLFHDSDPIRGQLNIRMGDPLKGGSSEFGSFVAPKNVSDMPSDIAFNDIAKIVFWNCAESLEDKFSANLGRHKDREDYLYHAPNNQEKYYQKKNPLELDIGSLEKMFATLSREFVLFGKGGVHENTIFLDYFDLDSYFLNSEGTEIFTNDRFFDLSFNFFQKDKEGLIIPHTFKLRTNEIPSYDFLYKVGIQHLRQLEKIVESPIQRNGEYPIILCAENAGVLFHEVAGHGAEGHRNYLTEFSETNLFKGKVGEKVAPDFVTLVDDPSIKEFEGIPVVSSYKYDDEGVLAKKVNIIENGIFKEFLHSRESAGFMKTESNGHSRYSFEVTNEPHPRMGVLIASSSKPMPFEKMKEKLIKICEKRNKPYGLYIKGKGHGWVMPQESFYNTYGSEMFRIYKSGAVKRVRGANVVGTPHNTLSNILEMGDVSSLDNGLCGAESGIVTQSIISPPCLLKGLEIKKIPKDEYGRFYEEILERK
jgi:predicted Zn-dependent protease